MPGTNENELRLFYYNEEPVPGVSLAVMWIRGVKSEGFFESFLPLYNWHRASRAYRNL